MARKRRTKSQPDLPLFEIDLPLQPDEHPDAETPADEGSSLLDRSALDRAEAERPGPTELALDDLDPAASSAGPEPEPLPLFPELADDPDVDEAAEDLAHEEAEASFQHDEEAEPARLRDRLLAGLADLSIIALVLATAVAGVLLMGVPLASGDQWPFGLLALTFSFLYTVIPLAFWGQTPGMAWLGLMAFGLEREPLTFHQTVWRWLGSLLTLALLGAPLLLALRGDSLGDRLSRSQTVAL